ncbi:DNA ligase [Thalassotalea sp. M1531]|uniref:DNA ligase n=1 Tax=Thalassotalea algicola TaxID=2716224 RepID=A0A7Y0LCN5_9GAMM|nr:DNA ligase [Thalassotalea algicola]NMP31867.1 DNA ligase [Thalassotalea algicola]
MHIFWLLILAFTIASPITTAAENNPLNIQLATTYQQEADFNQYWVSEKLDGVRGYWDGSQMYTRRGHRINLPTFFTKNWPNKALEGELWINRGQFEQIAAIANKMQAKDYEWQKVKFMLFDIPTHKGNFSERITSMRNIVLNANNRHLQMIEQYRVTDNAQLGKWLEITTSAGGEGLMLHKAQAYYKQGRSRNVMKLKPFYDAEALVIAHLPGKGKYLNKLGALRVKTNDGLIFKVGSGFSDVERENPPPIGSIITYKYSGKTSKGVPRFASFLRIRQLAKVD